MFKNYKNHKGLINLDFFFPKRSIRRKIVVKTVNFLMKPIRVLVRLFYKYFRIIKKILSVLKHSIKKPEILKDLEVWKSCFAGPDCKEIFENVYKNNLWGGYKGEFFSGSGSHEDYIIKPYIDVINDFLIKRWNNKSIVVDLGCGDFYIGEKLISHCSEYIACDVVTDLIEKLKLSGYPPHVKFKYLDITKHDLPEGDVCFVRQVLQHLSNEQIINVLSKLKKYKTVFITEHYPDNISKAKPNKDIVTGSGYRVSKNSAVFLDKPPFNVPTESLKLVLEIFDEKNIGIIRTYKLEF